MTKIEEKKENKTIWKPNTFKIIKIIGIILIFNYIVLFYMTSFVNNPNKILLISLISLSLILPFLIISTIVINANAFEIITETSWVKPIIYLVTTLYAIISNSWATDIINTTFNVPASFFPTTQIILTIFFFVTNIMQFIFVFLWHFILFFGSIAMIAYVLRESNDNRFHKTVKSIFFIFIASATYGSITNFIYYLPIIVDSIAEKTDFLHHSLCKEKYQSYIFISENTVLTRAKFYQNPPHLSYKFNQCTFDTNLTKN
jgi:hypothetical protein